MFHQTQLKNETASLREGLTEDFIEFDFMNVWTIPLCQAHVCCPHHQDKNYLI